MTDASDKSTEAAEEAAPAVDDVKEQMRKALEAKKNRHGQGTGGAASDDGGKIDTHAHGGSQRTFRRKSGSA